MSTRLDLLACYAAMAGMSVLSYIVNVPTLFQMLVFTVATIYIGCHHIISDVKHLKPSENSECMERSDVYLFPIVGSCVLFSLYICYKFLPTFVLTFIIKSYFVAIGSYTIYKRATSLILAYVPAEKVAPLEEKTYVVPLGAANEQVNNLRAKYAADVEPKIKPHLDKAAEVYGKASEVAGNVYEKVKPYLEQAETKLNSILGEEKKAASPADKAAAAAASASSAASNAAGAVTGAVAGVAGPKNDNWLPNEAVLNTIDLAGIAFAVFVAISYLLFNPAWANNIYGVFMSIHAIELMNLSSILNGTILLSALFIYDIFWVFGTDVMVTVAKNFDAPIKLVFPHVPTPSMLGLGDIVIPGLFLAMALRYDASVKRPIVTPTKPTPAAGQQVPPLEWVRFALDTAGSFNPAKLAFRTEYFNLTLIAYALGLVVTVFVMLVFKAAQPALLYLVPACLGALYGLAFSKGNEEFQAVFRYEHSEEAAPAAPVAAASSALSSIKSAAASVKSAASSTAADIAAAVPQTAPSAAEVDAEVEAAAPEVAEAVEAVAEDAADAAEDAEQEIRERATAAVDAAAE